MPSPPIPQHPTASSSNPEGVGSSADLSPRSQHVPVSNGISPSIGRQSKVRCSLDSQANDTATYPEEFPPARRPVSHTVVGGFPGMIRFWNPQGSASCICGVSGWLAATNWFSGHNWRLLLVSFVVFALGAVLAKRGIARGYRGVDRILPVAGAVLNLAGSLAILLPAIIWSTVFGVNRRRRR